MPVVAKLELARPALRLLVCGISFDASPLFPDVRGAITHDLLGALETKKWKFDGRELFVVNDEARRYVALEPEGMMFVAEEPPADPDALCREYLDIAHLALPHLKIRDLSSFAMNFDWHLALQKGSGLQAWLHEYLGLKAANTFFDAFGGKPQETEAKFSFMPQENVLVTAEIKVLDAEEAVEESFFEAEASEFPDESIELSLWRAEEPDEQFPLDDLEGHWTDSYSRLLRMSERAGTALLGPG
jgi:hypothetical protein